jgi:hypothetical protein
MPGEECTHLVWAEKEAHSVMLCNDADSWYCQEFKSRAQVEAFISLINSAADEAFGPQATNNPMIDREA